MMLSSWWGIFAAVAVLSSWLTVEAEATALLAHLQKSLRSSSARLHYDSDESFFKAMTDFHSAVTTSLPQSSNKKQQRAQTFVLKLSSTCDVDCHDLLRKAHGHNRYELLDRHHVVVTSTVNKVRLLQSAQSHLVSDVLVLHPQLKICNDIYEWKHAASSIPTAAAASTTTTTTEVVEDDDTCRKEWILEDVENGHMKAKTFPTFDLSIRTHPMDADSIEYASLTRFVVKLREQYKDAIEIDLPYLSTRQGKPLIETERDTATTTPTADMFYLRVSLRHCRDVYPVASLFAHRSEVVWIEKAYPIVTHNRWARGIIDTGTTELESLSYHNMSGIGQIVGVSDTGLDMQNCFFYDADAPTFQYQSASASSPVTNPSHRKVLQYISFKDSFDAESDPHGTHVSGIVAGQSYLNYGDFERFHGMSPDAKIAFFDIGDSSGALSIPSNVNTDLFRKLYAAGARIMTNSWGTTSSNSYDDRAVQVDTFLWNNPDATVFYSAGNTGASGYHTVTSPSTCKNGVSVGASGNDALSWKGLTTDGSIDSRVGKDSVAYFSSRGPTADNRQKPDILAPGYYVYSAKGHYNSTEPFCEALGLSGTSMAAPAAAGMAVKIREYFLQGYYPTGSAVAANSFIPSGALIKAMLITSARPVTSMVYSAKNATDFTKGYPAKETGYGRIQLSNVLNFDQASRNPLSMYVLGASESTSPYYTSFTSSGSRTLSFATGSTVPSYVRVTLAWTDYPGSSMSSNPLINTLSMSVSGNGQTYSAIRPSGLDADNVYVIDISNAIASTTYTITISGTISVSPQPYALVISSGDTVYLNSTSTAESTYDYQQSSNIATSGALVYVVVLIALTVLFGAIAFWLSRLIKAEKDRRRKLEIQRLRDQGVEVDVEEEQRGSLFSSWFRSSNSSSKNNNKKKTSKHQSKSKSKESKKR